MGKQTKEEPAFNTPAPTTANAMISESPAKPSYEATADTLRQPAAQQTAPPPAAASSSHISPSSAISRAVTESESLARDIKDGSLSGFVGAGTAVTGEATFKMMLRVDGHISGRVSSEDGTLIVSAGGQVDANVDVSVALINGTINGDIIATKRIEIGRVGKVIGNIQTPALIIENGAIFEGSCRMMQVKADHDKKQVNEVLSSVPIKKSEVTETAGAVS
ncbi:MAG TPA: polymer-forming cytoskeletal protein [Pyrinomonadaceae bacterium]|jgi:cytoskeletal protein CcmA (bactofilin family)|nr:polymer-forming cytoskeletal protein [Pyrinomonadaceae bacterium]